MVLAVAPESLGFNPPKLNIGTEKPDFTKNPIPWRCAGQFDAGNRLITAQYLCLLVRSRFPKLERMQETFLILEISTAHPAGTVYRRVGLGNIRGDR